MEGEESGLEQEPTTEQQEAQLLGAFTTQFKSSMYEICYVNINLNFPYEPVEEREVMVDLVERVAQSVGIEGGIGQYLINSEKLSKNSRLRQRSLAISPGKQIGHYNGEYIFEGDRAYDVESSNNKRDMHWVAKRINGILEKPRPGDLLLGQVYDAIAEVYRKISGEIKSGKIRDDSRFFSNFPR